ncbi:hypothetical protein E3N88_00309 [Mikania micrantha]|uniref:CCHC-type domain-containing protein n=1 Tax=Mikania micrantha TaxID=192012 RepID=A0A5N6PYJ4_9ASTR|nr:hypothetical protein E3N88_00309 [Mikania micrantha]
MAPRRGRSAKNPQTQESIQDPPVNGPSLNEADVARIAGDQLSAVLTGMLAQYQTNRASGSGRVHTEHNATGGHVETRHTTSTNTINPDPPQRGCTYKYFASCNPPTFTGKEGASGLLKWIESMETKLKISQCLAEHKVSYAACSLTDSALTWWNTQAKTLTTAVVDAMTWDEFKTLILSEYCPITEIQKLQEEFWNHSMIGADCLKYTDRFHELTCLLPNMFPTEQALIEKYIKGLVPQIKGMVTAAEPRTLKHAITLTTRLTDVAVRSGTLTVKGESSSSLATTTPSTVKGVKRKWVGKGKPGAPVEPSRNVQMAKGYIATTLERKAYVGQAPKCLKCPFHHVGPCPVCNNCNKVGHFSKYCNLPVRRSNQGTQQQQPQQNNRSCFRCGSPDHFMKNCPTHNTNQGNEARGRAFQIGAEEARRDNNTVTGTFLLNNHYVSVLFDTGADKSFVSSDFASLLGLAVDNLTNPYVIELANGKSIMTNNVIQGCLLNLNDHLFNIDLLPIELGSFDVVIGMDWLSENRVEVICQNKMIRISLPNGDTLMIQGERAGRKLSIISCMQARKCLRKGCQAFLAYVTENKPHQKRIEDIPVVREYPEVFPDDISGLPPVRQVEFRIDLVPGAAPIAKAPYRLAPSEMQELSSQLQELLDKVIHCGCSYSILVHDSTVHTSPRRGFRTRRRGVTPCL